MKPILLAFLTVLSVHVFAQKDTITNFVNWPLGMAEKDGFLYIAEADANVISRLDLNSDSDMPEVILDNLSRPNFMEFDGDYLYFSEFTGGRISRVDVSRVNLVRETFVDNLSSPTDILIYEGYLYFANNDGIARVALSEAAPIPEMIVYNFQTPFHLIAYEGQLIYTEYNSNKISILDLTRPEAEPQTLLGSLNGPLGGIAIEADELYFFEFGNRELSKFHLLENNPEVMAIDNNISGGDIHIVSNDLYVSDFQSDLILKYDNFLSTGVRNIALADLNVYPNPTADFISVDLSIEQSQSILSIVILDATGRFVSQPERINGTMDVEHLSSGAYFLLLRGENWVGQIEFVKI